MNEAPSCTVATKYGELLVTFRGVRELDDYRDLQRVKVRVHRATVQTESEKPLTVNGIQYSVHADLVYGQHWTGEKGGMVTEWYYVPGEYSSIHRAKHFGPFTIWTGDPTSKARAVIHDLCAEAVTKAVAEHPGIVTLAAECKLAADADRMEAEADELIAKAVTLKQEAALIRTNGLPSQPSA